MNIDPISNLICALKNGYRVSSLKVYVPFSKEKQKILEVLKQEGYIKNVKSHLKKKKKLLNIRLLYKENYPAVNEITRVSKPGQRIYAKPSQFKPVLGFKKSNYDCGTTIISTSKGVMTTKEAKKKNIGGELILKVY